jgi:hypothetical protein
MQIDIASQQGLYFTTEGGTQQLFAQIGGADGIGLINDRLTPAIEALLR